MHRRSIITTIGVAVVLHVLAITAYLAGTDRLQAFLTALTSVYTGPPSPEFVEGTINHRHSSRLITQLSGFMKVAVQNRDRDRNRYRNRCQMNVSRADFDPDTDSDFEFGWNPKVELINLRLPLLRRHRRTKIKWKFFHGWMNPVSGGFPNVEYKIDFEKRLIRWWL